MSDEVACACGCGQTFVPAKRTGNSHRKVRRFFSVACSNRQSKRDRYTTETGQRKKRKRAALIDEQIAAVRLKVYGDQTNKPSEEEVRKRLGLS